MLEEEPQFSIKSFFVPFTTSKAIHFLVIIGFLVFGNMLFNDFVWDDLSYIIFNPDVHTFNLVHLFQANGFNTVSQYRALAAVYFAILYNIFGNTSFFYHIIQLVLHIINSIFVLFLFKKFFSVRIAFFLSLLFLIHPMQVESVSFIGAAGNDLFFLFGISALFLLFRKKTKISNLDYAIYPLLLASVLTKETGVTFIFLSMLLPFLFHRKDKLISILFGIGVIVLYFIIRIGGSGIIFDAHTLTTVVPITDLSFVNRMANMPAILFYYLYTFVFPVNLAINQIWIISNSDFLQFFMPLSLDIIFLGTCFAACIYFYLHNKKIFTPFTFFLFWFLIGMGMHLQIIPLDMTVADRWFYFTIVGLLGMIGVIVQLYIKRLSSHYKNIALGIVICLISLLSLRSFVRNLDWANNIVLFSHDAAEMDNFQNENNLATFYSLRNQPQEALIHVKRSVSILPYDANLTNLGFIYENLNDYRDAEDAYKRVFTTPHRSSQHDVKESFAYLHLGGLYLATGKYADAEIIYKKALKKYPKNGVLWAFLAASQYNLHKQSEALESASKAKIYYPNDSTNNLYIKIRDKKDFDVRRL